MPSRGDSTFLSLCMLQNKSTTIAQNFGHGQFSTEMDNSKGAIIPKVIVCKITIRLKPCNQHLIPSLNVINGQTLEYINDEQSHIRLL
jgi:hypothetical protein